MTKIADRVNKSIAQRVHIPSTPADVSITLDKRLMSSTSRIPHVWTARIRTPSSSDSFPPIIVAKIYDPVYFDSNEAEWYDPFAVRDLTVSHEAEAYRRLVNIQGTDVPRCYGHFVTSLNSQQSRTVNVLLLEYIHGRDIRDLVPPEKAEMLCAPHKDTLIDTAIHLYLRIWAFGVAQDDMQPRNIILRGVRHHNTPFCSTVGCPLRFEADCKNMQMVMVDFELVTLQEQDMEMLDNIARTAQVHNVRQRYLKKWLTNRMA